MSDKKRAPKKVTIDYKNGKIYKLVNDVNDMIYVGSTTTTLSRRFSDHKQRAKSASAKIQKAIREIGADHFKIILIELFACTCKAELEAREYAVTNSFARETLYNSCFDGKPDDETRQKLRDNSVWKGRFGADSAVFKRGSISEYKSTGRAGFRFQWYENGVHRTKKFAYGSIRTREMAHLACIDQQDKIYPLTDKEYLQEPLSEDEE